MSDHLCITVRWLGDRFHGFTEDRSGPEWPPSPFRLLQALVAGAYQYGVYNKLKPALAWLERQPPPEILAEHRPARANGFDHYVPDNDYRLDHKKPVLRVIEPILLPERPSVTYIWRPDPSDTPPIDEIDELCSTLSSFGCGVDQAFAAARLARIEAVAQESVNEAGQFRHTPSFKAAATSGTLRTPKQGSLDNLNRVFSLNQRNAMIHTERRKKRWPTVFDRFVYSGIDAEVARPHTVFKLLVPNGEDPATYPHAKLMHIAAMTRSLAIMRCLTVGLDPDFVNRFVRGKNEPARDDHRQLSYVPLPSIGHGHADARVRNLMLVAPVGMDEELAHVVRAIDGQVLKPERDEGESDCEAQSIVPDNYRAELQSFTPPRDKFIAKCYLASSGSRIWETVTPIILDHHVKKVDRQNLETGQIEKVWNYDEVICLALRRAGIETPCRFTWQSIPFIKHGLTAHRYDKKQKGYYRPKRFDGKTAVHVRITFEHPVPGPITLGAGRHCGFGLMAAIDDR